MVKRKFLKENFNKFIAKSYALICKIYQQITTFYENQFLKISSSSKLFSNKGIFNLPIQESIIFNNIKNPKLIKTNEYLNIKTLKNDQINSLIRDIFTKNLRSKITEITGFNFSIDFMIFYERQYIPNSKRNLPTLKQPYSYRWHFDKPNSSNMLKIFIPIDIESKSGPLEVISKEKSEKIKSSKDIDKSLKKIFFEGKGNIIYGLYPTLCCHRDGIPKKKVLANQIMFQLNPNKEWVINSRIFKKNSIKKNRIGIWTNEPKFPHISYIFNERIELN